MSRVRLAAAAFALVLCAGGVAEAKNYRVKISTKPAGARVELGAGGGKVLGKTPLTTRLPAGEHIIVITLDGFVESVETVSVRRNNRSFKFSLERAEVGSVRVVSKKKGALRGALIYVDGEQVGRVPDTIKVEAGARQIEVKKAGFKPFEKWVEVSVGDQVVVEADAMSQGSENKDPFTGKTKPDGDDDDDDVGDDDDDDDDDFGDDDDDDVGDDDDDDDDGDDDDDRTASVESSDEDGPRVTKKRESGGSARPRGSLVLLEAGIDVSGRSFSYNNPQSSNLRPFGSFGSPMFRIGLEAYPLGFTGSALLRGIGLTAGFGRAPPLNSTAKVGDMEVAVPTQAGDYSFGARYRYPISEALMIGGGVSMTNRFYRFDDSADPAIEGTSPEVEYKQLVIGADATVRASPRMLVILRADFINISDIGVLQDRFTVTGQSGFGGSAGVRYQLSGLLDIVGRFSYSRMSLSFEEMATGEFRAAGASDQFYGGLLGIGLAL